MIRIGFFGTPEIASCCLEELCGDFHVSFVVAGEDKPAGRHQHMTHCAAKGSAMCRDIPILQPHSLRDPAFIDTIKKFDADIYVVVAYGKIIPREIFDHPSLKTINLHPSLLPRYRGAAPVPWAIIRGETETGVTVQLINEELDAGDIIVQEKVRIHENMTAGELYDVVIPMGSRMLSRAIGLLASGEAMPRPQDPAEATYCGKITRELAAVDWTRPSAEIHNLVRGLNPKPGAWTLFRGKNVKIWGTLRAEDCGEDLRPGELHVRGKKTLLAGTGSGCIEITSIQPETKKTMDGPSFINGYRLTAGDSFGV